MNNSKSGETAFVRVIREAPQIAGRFGVNFAIASYNTFHLLLSLMRNDRWLAMWLDKKGVSINDLLSCGPEDNNLEPFSMGMLLAKARKLAESNGVERHPIHLLFAILSFGEEAVAKRVLWRQNCDPSALLREIVSNHWHRSPPQLNSEEDADGVLETMGIDYTKLAREGKLKPVIGRGKEIRSVIEILARKDTAGYDEAINNPVLLGEPGVGKSAIAKGLARLIADRDLSVQPFWEYRVVYLKLSDMQAGTGIRGSLELRFKALLEECSGGQPTILFLDELHTIVGLGRTEGSSGMEESLKPALAEGLSCIGATTTDEWREKVETKNPPFAERWIQVRVEEPSSEDMMQILLGSADDLARRHLVHFSGEVLSAAISLGEKYLHYVASPRREIDQILNGVGAKVKLANRVMASVEDVAEVISQIVGYEVKPDAEERQKVANAYEILSTEIIGQNDAMQKFADLIIRHRSGVQDEEKPPVMLLLGPTGVGKTLSARLVAKHFFADKLIRVDMSEFMERHTASRLTGAPPGYIGYDKPGQLTEPLRRFGRAVVLLDEIEKAHDDVFNILLQLFDEGRLTDGKGRTVSGRNCIFLMTSNLGSEYFAGSVKSIGFGATAEQSSFAEAKKKALEEARRHFRPEIFNRIDEIIVFDRLEKMAVETIAKNLLQNEKEKCAHLGFALEWEADVINFLVEQGFSPTYGARPMKRQIMKSVQNILAKPILRGEIIRGDRIKLFVQNNLICWRK
ncbi:MAG: ATP-dependent Clp protease ATP-binding subunit [bacterium]|nr:ATP-dependent Clp protease ATP-binding subunit [bacterium]